MDKGSTVPPAIQREGCSCTRNGQRGGARGSSSVARFLPPESEPAECFPQHCRARGAYFVRLPLRRPSTHLPPEPPPAAALARPFLWVLAPLLALRTDPLAFARHCAAALARLFLWVLAVLLLPTQNVYGGPEESSYLWLQVCACSRFMLVGGCAFWVGRLHLELGSSIKRCELPLPCVQLPKGGYVGVRAGGAAGGEAVLRAGDPLVTLPACCSLPCPLCCSCLGWRAAGGAWRPGWSLPPSPPT